MEIGGKMMDAELLPADKARRIYEDIVRTMRDPALLEYAGRDHVQGAHFSDRAAQPQADQDFLHRAAALRYWRGHLSLSVEHGEVFCAADQET